MSVPIGQLYKHIVKSTWTHQPIYVNWWVNRRYSFCLDTIFSYRHLHNSYRIAHTSRIRDILLLLILMPTCQISMLTFTIRFYMIYYCGWWCRGNTHLQMQWQGWMAYSKTLHRVKTWHMEQEATWMESWQKQQITVKSSSSILYHWIQSKSREHDKHIWSVVRLRFGPVAASLNTLIDLLWRTIATSHTIMCSADDHSNTITLLFLKKHVHMAHANRSIDMHH